MLLGATHSALPSPPFHGYAVILSIAVRRQKLYHKQRVPGLFKKKNDRDLGLGGRVKGTQRMRGVVLEEAVDLVVRM